MTRIATCALLVLDGSESAQACCAGASPTDSVVSSNGALWNHVRVWSTIVPAVVRTQVAPKWPFEGGSMFEARFSWTPGLSAHLIRSNA